MVSEYLTDSFFVFEFLHLSVRTGEEVLLKLYSISIIAQ